MLPRILAARPFLVAAFVAGTLAASLSSAHAEGALAADRMSGSYGYSYGMATKADADKAAIASCGAKCTVVANFSKGCAAYANCPGGAQGVGLDGNAEAAQKKAVEACRNQGGGSCAVRVWGCEQ